MSPSIPESILERFGTFGDLLRFLRRRVSITQVELATAVGYSDAQISRLEQNLRLPDIPTIEARFISALGLENEPRAVARLLDLAANVRREDAPAFGACPYKGLNYFDEADTELFAGREALTAGLTERVLALALSTAPEPRFLAVVGASGSGKSSLLRAGLVPALRWNKRSADWRIQVFTPTAQPLESLAASLTDSVAATATLMDDLVRDPRSLQLFVRRLIPPANSSRLLLVVDQFEELFALCRSEETRTSFIDSLLTAASEAGGPTTTVIALRADFYAHCAGHVELREALAQQQEYIGVMSDEELRRAIEEPARRGRWEFEPGLVDLLLHEVGHEPGALPLLSHALLETWQRRRGHTLTLSGYASSGGVRGAIAETAEAVFADQFTPEQQVIARRIFLRLTELGDATATGDTRRRAAFSELVLRPEETATTQAVLKALADARLITTSEDSAEVAHEALIREWPTLRGWLEENRESLRFHRHLTEASQEWSAAGREPDLLYRGARLTQVREWVEAHSGEMNDLERAFVDASRAGAEKEAAEREAQRQRELLAAQQLAEEQRHRAEEQSRAAVQLRRGAFFLVSALVVAVAAALAAGLIADRNVTLASQNAAIASTAESDFARADQQARLASSRAWAAAAVSSIGVDADRSILLALEAVSVTYSVDGGWTGEAEEALHRTISAAQQYVVLRGHTSGVNDVAFSPDGTRLATASLDGTAKVWDAATGKELLTLPGGGPAEKTGGRLYTVAMSPDGRQLATAGEGGVLTIWNATSGEALLTLGVPGEPTAVYSVTFSPDAARLASASADGTVRVWDLATGQISLTLSIDLTPPPDQFTIINTHDVAFSPDGTRFATVGPDKTARIWDAVTGEELLSLAGHREAILALAYSPDGTHVATASYDATTKVWDGETGAELLTVSGETSRNIGAAFALDGERLAVVSDDGTAIVWDASAGQELFRLSGHASAIRAVAFSPDGSRIATAGDDGTARLWQAAPTRELLTLTGHTKQVYGGQFSPDGTRLLTSGTEGTVKVWNASTGQLFLTLSSTDVLEGGTFSPDGRLIATGGDDQKARIWDAATGRLLKTLSGHASVVFAVKFSPDGARLATPSGDKTVKIWDVVTGRELFTLSGHAGGVVWLNFSPDGARLITAGEDDVAIVWDLATQKPVFSLPMPTGFSFGVSFSPDGARLLTTDTSEIARVWDARTGKLLLELSGHVGGVYGAAWSPDGTRIATASADKTAKLWDAVTGEELLTLYGHSAVVGGVAFSPDGRRLATMSDDSTVRLYVLRMEELMALAKTRVTRTLTTEECQKYMHVEKCPNP